MHVDIAIEWSVTGNVLTLEPGSDQRELEPCNSFDEETVSVHSSGEEKNVSSHAVMLN